MIKGKPYESPPAPYKPGQKVKFEGERRTVKASSHTHTLLEGDRFAIANWILKLGRVP